MACLNPPTLYRKVKITEINAEICRACQVLSLNLADKYQTQTETADLAPPMTTQRESLERSSDPSNSTRNKAGMVWCPEGLWVFPLKCDRCREQTYRQWYECHTEKLKKKGEELGKCNATPERTGANSADQENQTQQCQSTARPPS